MVPCQQIPDALRFWSKQARSSVTLSCDWLFLAPRWLLPSSLVLPKSPVQPHQLWVGAPVLTEEASSGALMLMIEPLEQQDCLSWLLLWPVYPLPSYCI